MFTIFPVLISFLPPTILLRDRFSIVFSSFCPAREQHVHRQLRFLGQPPSEPRYKKEIHTVFPTSHHFPPSFYSKLKILQNGRGY